MKKLKHLALSCATAFRNNTQRISRRAVGCAVLTLAACFGGQSLALAQAPMRRPISPSQPMLMVHIDTWNYPDPERIIEMVPEDIKPYVVFNLSLSASKNVCPGGPGVCDSWLKACAQHNVWAMVQCASGGWTNFLDKDLSYFENYYRQYPNFIGWNYAEQFWGYGEDDERSATFDERMNHFAELMKISHKYGGYLVVSFTQAFYSPERMPMGYMKDYPALAEQLRAHPEHFICCEKYTMSNGFYDIESHCLGAYLGGYAGQYGIRFDDCGWSANDSDNEKFVTASGAIPTLEHVMLTGETVIDGPELIWVNCSKETSQSTTSDGFRRRNWDWFPQYRNITMDLFRKVLDGTVRILSRKEVIDRTKICLYNDNNKGNNEDYMSPNDFFNGVYRPECDYGSILDNKWWMKTTGRYPTIPQICEFLDDDAKSLIQVKRSTYSSRWPNIAAKQKELNELFPQEYTGDIYAAHAENTWMTYNPYQYDDTKTNGERTRKVSKKRATGEVPFLYNTTDGVSLDLCPYGLVLMKEYTDSVMFYLSNYRNEKYFGVSQENTLADDVITIKGCSSRPTLTIRERGSHIASKVKEEWSGNELKITVSHNGPIEILAQCKGANTGRLTTYTEAKLEKPLPPSPYYGDLQYEAECFDYKNIGNYYTNGYNRGYDGYYGQGFINMGTNSAAEVRDTISVPRDGSYRITLRYQSPGKSSSMMIYYNTSRTAITATKTTDGAWHEVSKTIKLKKGENVVRIKYGTSFGPVYLDCIKISSATAGTYDFEDDDAATAATTPAANYVEMKAGEAGVVASNGSNALKGYSASGLARFTLFGRDMGNSAIEWQLTEGESSMILRDGYRMGIVGGKAVIEQVEIQADGTVKVISTLAEQAVTTAPTWLRAAAIDNKLYLLSSTDKATWTEVLQASSDALKVGSTILSWQAPMMVDNITQLKPGINLSAYALRSFSLTRGQNEFPFKSLTLNCSDALSDIRLDVSNKDFQISTDSLNGWSNEITIAPGEIKSDEPVTIYVRMNNADDLGTLTGNLTISSQCIEDIVVPLEGIVIPPSIALLYDFEGDAAKASASNPPADDITVGKGNTAQAGVAKYTVDGNNSNMLRIYGVSNSNNGTGVLDFNRFTTEATDYSVTWRQVTTLLSTSYKNGVVLRADPSSCGTSTTYYTQGMRGGYYCCAYNNGNNTEMRIYKSTSTGIQMKASAGVSLNPATKANTWYRASISGSTEVLITFEYSTDGVTWNTGTSYRETSANDPFLKGSTQFVWGLAAARDGFLIDDIAFQGVTYDKNATAIINPASYTDEIKSEKCFNLQGVQVNPAHYRGIILRHITYKDGTTQVRKELVR